MLLSDGPRNSAYYEHATIARLLGLPLVLLDQLSLRGGRLYARLPDGERAVDVVYRRTDEDRLCDERGEPTDIARLLLEPCSAARSPSPTRSARASPTTSCCTPTSRT